MLHQVQRLIFSPTSTLVKLFYKLWSTENTGFSLSKMFLLLLLLMLFSIFSFKNLGRRRILHNQSGAFQVILQMCVG